MKSTTTRSQKSSTTNNKKATDTLSDPHNLEGPFTEADRRSFRGMTRAFVPFTVPMPTPESTREEFDRAWDNISRMLTVVDLPGEWMSRLVRFAGLVEALRKTDEEVQAAIATCRKMGFEFNKASVQRVNNALTEYSANLSSFEYARNTLNGERDRVYALHTAIVKAFKASKAKGTKGSASRNG